MHNINHMARTLKNVILKSNTIKKLTDILSRVDFYMTAVVGRFREHVRVRDFPLGRSSSYSIPSEIHTSNILSIRQS